MLMIAKILNWPDVSVWNFAALAVNLVLKVVIILLFLSQSGHVIKFDWNYAEGLPFEAICPKMNKKTELKVNTLLK